MTDKPTTEVVGEVTLEYDFVYSLPVCLESSISFPAYNTHRLEMDPPTRINYV